MATAAMGEVLTDGKVTVVVSMVLVGEVAVLVVRGACGAARGVGTDEFAVALEATRGGVARRCWQLVVAEALAFGLYPWVPAKIFWIP